jgi:hypothetical protein
MDFQSPTPIPTLRAVARLRSSPQGFATPQIPPPPLGFRGRSLVAPSPPPLHTSPQASRLKPSIVIEGCVGFGSFLAENPASSERLIWNLISN